MVGLICPRNQGRYKLTFPRMLVRLQIGVISIFYTGDRTNPPSADRMTVTPTTGGTASKYQRIER